MAKSSVVINAPKPKGRRLECMLDLRMPKDLKNKWVLALRSGKYAQDKGLLKTEHGYCCLGVLQHVADGKVETHDKETAYATHAIGESFSMPTGSWIANHGLEHKNLNSDLVFLSDKNDNGGWTFKDIADWVEENVEGY